MSGEKPRWVKRKRQISRVESMLAAKAQKSSPAVALEGPSQLEDQSNSEEQAMSMSADESFILPRVHSSDEESNTDTESEFTESDAKIAYQEWISSQSKTYVQMLALILMDSFRDRFGMTDVGAASEILKQKVFRII